MRLVVAESKNVSAYLARTDNAFAYSGSSLRMNKSIAAEKAANANPPPRAAFGPEFRASTPPAMNPAVIGFTMSFFARY
jgi:hypothetical protein